MSSPRCPWVDQRPRLCAAAQGVSLPVGTVRPRAGSLTFFADYSPASSCKSHFLYSLRPLTPRRSLRERDLQGTVGPAEPADTQKHTFTQTHTHARMCGCPPLAFLLSGLDRSFALLMPTVGAVVEAKQWFSTGGSFVPQGHLVLSEGMFMVRTWECRCYRHPGHSQRRCSRPVLRRPRPSSTKEAVILSLCNPAEKQWSLLSQRATSCSTPGGAPSLCVGRGGRAPGTQPAGEATR